MSQALESANRLSTQKIKPKHQTIKNIRQLILLVSVLSLSTFSCGYTIAYITALGYKNLKFVYGQTAVINVVRAFILACVPFGISFGTMIAPWILTLGSRRNLALTLSIFAECLLGIIQIQHLAAFFIVRSFQGITTGILLVLIPLYIKEITPREIAVQTRYGVFEKSFLLLGFVVPFGLNIIMVKNGLHELIRWRIIVTANALPILVVIVAILTNFIPESPVSYILKKEEEKAKQVMGLFYKKSQVDRVYKERVKQLEIVENMDRSIWHSAKRICKLRALLTFEIPLIHQLTGVNAYISQMGFVMSAYNQGFSIYIPFIMTSTQLLTMILSSTYVTRATSRTIILVGNIGMGLCCLGIGTCLILIDSYRNAFWIIVALVIVLLGFNGGTFLSAVGIYVSDVGTRPLVRWSLIANWFVSATTIVLFIVVGGEVGYAAVFLGFGTIVVLGFIFNLFWMIQTRQKITKNNIQLRIAPKIQQKAKVSI